MNANQLDYDDHHFTTYIKYEVITLCTLTMQFLLYFNKTGKKILKQIKGKNK